MRICDRRVQQNYHSRRVRLQSSQAIDIVVVVAVSAAVVGFVVR